MSQNGSGSPVVGFITELSNLGRFVLWAPSVLLSATSMLINFVTSAVSLGLFGAQFFTSVLGTYLSGNLLGLVAWHIVSPFPWEMWFFNRENLSKFQPKNAVSLGLSTTPSAKVRSVERMFVEFGKGQGREERTSATSGSRIETFFVRVFGTLIGIPLLLVSLAIAIVRLPFSVLNVGWTFLRLQIDEFTLWVGTDHMDAKTFWAARVFEWEVNYLGQPVDY